MRRTDAEALVRLLESVFGAQADDRRAQLLNWLAANLEGPAGRTVVDRYIDRASVWPMPADLRRIADGETTSGLSDPIADVVYTLARQRDIPIPDARRIVEEGLREARGEIPEPPGPLARELGLREAADEADRYERLLAHLATRSGPFSDRIHVLVAGAYERLLGGPRQMQVGP